jgi:ankyrin repeat protein
MSKEKRISALPLLFMLLSLFPIRAQGQWELIENPSAVQIDTSDYIPYVYEGAINYNLMIAASKGYSGEIKRLIAKGAEINSETTEGATPLIFAVSSNKTEAVNTLLSYNPDIDKFTAAHETALLIAVKNMYFEIAEALIRAGADINLQDSKGATALHYSALFGYLDMTDMLLYYDADKNIRANDGSTPMMGAIWAGYIDIADLLVQRGADVNIKDSEGLSPFMIAAFAGDTITMAILQKKGADIYAVNNTGQNALSLAIAGGQTETVKYLLKSGKWSAQKNSDPYSTAAKLNRKDIIQILRDNNVPGKINYGIDLVSFSLSSRFTLHDNFSGFSLSFKEPYLNTGVKLGIDSKLWYTRVLMKSSDDLFYQYRTKSSLIYGGLFHDFVLNDIPNKFTMYLSTTLSAGYSFGSVFKGTSNTAETKLKVIPSVSLKLTYPRFSVDLGMEYVKSGFYKVGPVWFRAGLSYNYFFDNLRTRIKPVRWY